MPDPAQPAPALREGRSVGGRSAEGRSAGGRSARGRSARGRSAEGRAGRGRLSRVLRRVGILFGTGWSAAPRLMVGCVLAAVGSAVFSLIYPLGYRTIVDGATAHDAGRILIGVVVVAVAFPVSWVLLLVGASRNSKLTDQANLSLGLKIGALVNEAPFLEHFERPEHLAQIDNLREKRRVLAGAPSQVLSMLRSGIGLVGAGVLLALIWPPLIVVPFLSAAPALADRRAGAIEKRSDDELADSNRLLRALFSLASTAGPARELRSFDATRAILERHASLGDEVNRRSLRVARRAALWEAAGWFVYAAGFAGTVVVLVVRATHAGSAGAITPGEVVEAVSLLRRAQRQVSGAVTSAGSFATASTTADRLLWLEDYVEGASAGQATQEATTSSGGSLGNGPQRVQPPSQSSTPPERLTSGIGLEDVSFTYPGQDELTLQDVDLHLAAGSTVAIVGENGAGKSTLIKLLTGMYRPTSGRILVDGADLTDLSPAAWRASTTGAFQDFVQFQMALGDGVGAGDLPRIEDREAVMGALVEADAASLVSELPNGMETLLGPWAGGRSLSGGQWQRLALARGLMLRCPLLVVLDEPTASLDAPSEAALFARYQEAAVRLGRTNGTITILVSHRFSTVHMADQIVVMDHGRVAETGDHLGLIRCGGLYAELFKLQAKGYVRSLATGSGEGAGTG